MINPTPNLGRKTLRRLIIVVRRFLASETSGRKAWLLLACLVGLMVAITGLNVVNSYVGRWFFSAIERRDATGFMKFAWLYLVVFGGSTCVAVLFRFCEERLGLLWREWLTRRITTIYIDYGLYLPALDKGGISNPDQRMTEDVRQLTTTTLSFFLLVVNGTMTVLSFSSVLWMISPKLFFVAILYASLGSAMTIWLGRPLIRLNYAQSDLEADFRSELIKVREDGNHFAKSIGTDGLKQKLNNRIDDLTGNFRRIIGVNRNLGFFTTGYNYLIQLIPVFFIAPMFIEGKVEFGVIGQATMAFATLLGAFSLVITQFQAISSYASVITRLGEFVEYAEREGYQ
jgi:putative ATP-binding cassette transporter